LAAHCCDVGAGDARQGVAGALAQLPRANQPVSVKVVNGFSSKLPFQNEPGLTHAVVIGGQTGPMLSVGVVVLGVEDVEGAVAFWREALGYELRTDGFGGWAKVLVPPGGGAGPKVALQRSQTPLQDHPRLHLDLHVASPAEQTAEVERLVALGAARVDWDSYPDDPDFVVLADPDGNRFCIVDLSHDHG
jgi:catechol 2,3-dioxygenase-like lactoylglutathione lyase family enzyme